VLDRNLSHVASKLAEGVRMVTSWPVAAVTYAQTDGGGQGQRGGGGGCEVRGRDGRVVRCERVVVAVPLNVLKAADIEFAPPLPEPVRRALGAMAMGNAVKVRTVSLTAYAHPSSLGCRSSNEYHVAAFLACTLARGSLSLQPSRCARVVQERELCRLSS